MAKHPQRNKFITKYFIHTIFILLSAIFIISLFSEKYSYKQDTAIIGKREKTLIDRIRSLEESLKSSKTIEIQNAEDYISKSGLKMLKSKGLKDPIKDIKKDLMKNARLIPFKGSLGGSMGFYSEKNIKVLSDKWVLADFSDGHNEGKMILRFDVSNKGKIAWKVVDYYLE